MRHPWRRRLPAACVGVTLLALLVSCRAAGPSPQSAAGPPTSPGRPPETSAMTGAGTRGGSAAPAGAPPSGQPAAQDPPASSLRFVLASTGLPARGIWKSTPALVDINRDGVPDLVAHSRAGQGPQVWLGRKDGTWADASRGLQREGCGGGVAVADLNRDGHLDLAVADHCAGVSVYLGDGQGQWRLVAKNLRPALSRRQPASRTAEEEEEDDPAGAEDVAIGDVNEDGALDLVTAASFGEASPSTWATARESPGARSPSRTACRAPSIPSPETRSRGAMPPGCS